MKYECKDCGKLFNWEDGIIVQVGYHNMFSDDTGGNLEIYCKKCYKKLKEEV